MATVRNDNDVLITASTERLRPVRLGTNLGLGGGQLDTGSIKTDRISANAVSMLSFEDNTAFIEMKTQNAWNFVMDVNLTNLDPDEPIVAEFSTVTGGVHFDSVSQTLVNNSARVTALFRFILSDVGTADQYRNTGGGVYIPAGDFRCYMSKKLFAAPKSTTGKITVQAFRYPGEAFNLGNRVTVGQQVKR